MRNPRIPLKTSAIAGLALGAFVLIGLMGLARAHDAIPTAAQPLGWSYGYECCSLLDCRTAAQSEIAETPDGYVYRKTGEVIAYSDTKRLKDSKDEDFHICTRGGKEDGEVICLYRAPRGF